MALAGLQGCGPGDPAESKVVGVFGSLGLVDGAFNYPRAISAGADGRIYVVDKTGRVQRFSPEGEFETAWNTPIIDQGKPVGVAVHPDGRILVADTHYSRVLIYPPDGGHDGEPLATFGTHGTGPGEMMLPTDVAIDREGNFYVSEYLDNDRITKWSPEMTFIAAFGDTPIEGRRLARPTGLVIDGDQTLWVADSCNHRLVRFSLDGEVMQTVGEYGHDAGQLRYPYDISLSPEGTLMVCEYEGCRLQWFSRDGTSLGTWGTPGRKPGQLHSPWGAVYGANGNIYVLDSLNSRVQILQP